MSQASLREGAAGELQLAGVLDYSSGPACASRAVG